MIRDRGRIKWVSLMLPEHRKKLQELKEEEERREPPLLDEQHLEELNRILTTSLKERKRVSIHFYRDKKICRHVGQVQRYHLLSRSLILKEGQVISLEKITHLEVLDEEE